MPAKQSWVNRFNSPRLVTIVDPYYEFSQYGDEPNHHPIHQHLKRIFTAITENNSAQLKDLLTYDLQCSAEQDSLPADLDVDGNEIRPQYLITTRPFLEGLILINVINFRQIVENIAQQDNLELNLAFIASLKTTALSAETLFSWSATQQKQLHKSINEIDTYGKSLKQNGIAKHFTLSALARELRESEQLIEITQYEDNSRPEHCDAVRTRYQHYFTLLKNKLNFCTLLHSQDKILNEHRKATPHYAELLLGIIGLGFFNLMNYFITGNLLFFNKTDSRRRIEQVDSVIQPFKRTI